MTARGSVPQAHPVSKFSRSISKVCTRSSPSLPNMQKPGHPAGNDANEKTKAGHPPRNDATSQSVEF
jgi:hypothetical protein